MVLALAPAKAEHRAYSLSADYYNESWPSDGTAIFRPSEMVYGGIVPHHLLVKDWLGKYFAGLSKQQYDTVILIGPNHADAGRGKLIISNESFATPFGVLETNRWLAQKLSSAGLAQIEEAPFASEQSIVNLAGFIKKAFPQANFLPIVVRRDASAAEMDKLASTLAAAVNPARTLILASVDFSHYQTAAVADFHDARTNGCLAAFDYSCLQTAEVDSPLSLRALLKYLEAVGARKDTLVYRTNSSALLKQPDEPGTSHSFHVFTKGEAAKDSAYNLLFFGDLMMDRHVGELITKQKGQVDFLLNGLSGEERRFWMGNDLTSANLESALTKNGAHYPPSAGIDFAFAPELLAQFKNYNFNYFNIANNHITDQGTKGFAETQANLKNLGYSFAGCGDQSVRSDCSGTIVQARDKRIAMLGASMVYGDIDKVKLAAEIARLKPQADLVIVQLHWGNEYQSQFNKKQQELAYYLVDHGADLIIGHHPHVIKGVEIYKDKTIFYSLGNFVFDQYWSLPTQRGLAVGVSWSGDNFSFQLFPLVANHSAVSLAKGAEKVKWLKQVAATSAVSSSQKTLLTQGYLSTSSRLTKADFPL